jgi:polyhydroxyalkanoate synthase
MTEDSGSSIKFPDPVEWSKTMARIAEASQRMVSDFLHRQGSTDGLGMGDPLNIGHAFLEMAARMMTDPAKIMQAQMSLWQDYLNLWQNATLRFLGESTQPVVSPAKEDKRFKDAAWNENVVFDYLKQSYLLTARWLQQTTRSVEGLDDKTAKKVDFYTRQFVDAMAPSNFVMTNPEVLRTTIESGGENLLRGLNNLLTDLERGHGSLSIRMTDPDAFRIGGNIAVTPGKVVYRNALMELIQYAPATESQHRRPLLIVPPWINKYYILDLRETNSLIKWTTEQGLTTFVISWVNPDEHLAKKSFEDYMIEGLLDALTAIEQATGEAEVNAVGYCLGGTLLACTLAYMAAKNDKRVHSATYLATLVDFSEVGEIAVFIDEEQIEALEQRMSRTGYLEGNAMATTFNMLRANDLIWSFVVSNYLLGKDPFPFDLLYWNSDATRMPAAMHSFYLRKMYQENRLIEAGGIELGGVPVDLRRIDTPSFIVATREDHIAPWRTVYAATQLYAGPVTFVLGASGHIAGIVNPPAAAKYNYWASDRRPADPEEWLKGAQAKPGSWWPEWRAWLAPFAGDLVPARVPGSGKLKALADAPGTYVKVRIG